jgi:hypothetical protein
MIKYISMKTTLAIICLALMTSCHKQVIGPLTDKIPNVPVLVTNAFDYRPQPTVKTSKAAGGIITITMEIPASTGRKIKEITRVAASTTYSAVQTATTVSTNGLYITGPVVASGPTTVTFTTSIAEYAAKTGTSAAPPSNAELGRLFYFIITLDDNTVIITDPVRVFVVD